MPVFPLAGALLLPSGQMPLNIFEPRYLAMIDAAMGGDRLIGMIQPALDAPQVSLIPPLCEVGCLGRITQFSETGDGRYAIMLSGVSRFRIVEELAADTPYRQCRISVDGFADLTEPRGGEDDVDRSALLRTFRDYLDANGLEADWDSVNRASNAGLVTALSMMSPWGPPEKQALLESPDHATRARTLIAITEMALAGANAPSRAAAIDQRAEGATWRNAKREAAARSTRSSSRSSSARSPRRRSNTTASAGADQPRGEARLPDPRRHPDPARRRSAPARGMTRPIGPARG